MTLEAHWPGLSVAAFVASLLFDYGRAWIWPREVVWIVGSLCGFGALAGLFGWRHPTRRWWSRAGLVLNGMICLFLMTLQIIYRWY